MRPEQIRTQIVAQGMKMKHAELVMNDAMLQEFNDILESDRILRTALDDLFVFAKQEGHEVRTESLPALTYEDITTMFGAEMRLLKVSSIAPESFQILKDRQIRLEMTIGAHIGTIFGNTISDYRAIDVLTTFVAYAPDISKPEEDWEIDDTMFEAGSFSMLERWHNRRSVFRDETESSMGIYAIDLTPEEIAYFESRKKVIEQKDNTDSITEAVALMKQLIEAKSTVA